VVPVLYIRKCPRCQLLPEMLVERRNIFHNSLLQIVKDQHREFLASLHPPIQVRDGIFNLLRSPGINSASLCSLAGRYDNPIPTRILLAPIDCSKIPAQGTFLYCTLESSVANPDAPFHSDAKFFADPNPPFCFDADPDLIFPFDADPDPIFHLNADPDPKPNSCPVV
jgi:hypothetical protein